MSICVDCERVIDDSVDDYESVVVCGTDFYVHAECCTDPDALLDHVRTRRTDHVHRQRTYSAHKVAQALLVR